MCDHMANIFFEYSRRVTNVLELSNCVCFNSHCLCSQLVFRNVIILAIEQRLTSSP
jgi:hypothetical protein